MSIKVVCRKVCSENEIIQNAVCAANDFNDLSEANRYFCNLCKSVSYFEMLSNNVYRYKDFFINVGKRMSMAFHAEGLRIVADLGLSCLPELAAYIWLDNDEDMVLITRIKNSCEKQIVPFEGKRHLTETARKNLFDDVERLLDKGYTVAALMNDSSAWYVLEDRSTIILPNCELVSVPEKAKDAFRKRVAEILDSM